MYIFHTIRNADASLLNVLIETSSFPAKRHIPVVMPYMYQRRGREGLHHFFLPLALPFEPVPLDDTLTALEL